jgi:dephospho-CoA kinase
VRKMLENAGVATIDADSVGHEVLERTGPAFGAVAARWPDVVVDDEIDRSALAEVVFGDPDELRELESITHPHIFDTIKARVEELEPPIVVEMPLLQHSLGRAWSRMVVDSREDARLARAIDRGMPEGDARARLAAQPSRAQWLATADLVVPNHRSMLELRDAVSTVLRYL